MMKNKVINYINENRMIDVGDRIIVGVSGGADSMCLLHLLNSVKEIYSIGIFAVHIHHGIRGEGADRDASFVEEYCSKWNIPLQVFRYDVPRLAMEWGMSCEEAGRKVRYEAFDQVLHDKCGGKGKITVAHNADDQAETVLHNLCRGSSIKGLAGILPVRDNIIRPILCLTRDEIERYDNENGIDFVTDETNLSDDYTRNKIRNVVLPAIVDGINDRAREHINMTAQSLAFIDDFLEESCRSIYEQIVTRDEGFGLNIFVIGFRDIHVAMKWQLVKKCLYEIAGKAKDITRKHMLDVIELFDMQVGKMISLPYNMCAERKYDSVHIYRKAIASKDSNSMFMKNEDENLHIDRYGEYHLNIANKTISFDIRKDSYTEAIFEENQYTKWIDCDIMESNLQLRTRREGDYIVVDHNGSKKKLKDFFIDKKIPRQERDNVLLLADGNQIIWIVGYRLNAAYKVSAETKNIIRLHIDIEAARMEDK